MSPTLQVTTYRAGTGTVYRVRPGRSHSAAWRAVMHVACLPVAA